MKVQDPAQAGKGVAPFDLTAVIVSYLRARKRAPEDDIERMVEARAEERSDDTDWGGVTRRLFDLVQAGVLSWHDPPGGDAGGTLPLIYSLTRKGRAS